MIRIVVRGVILAAGAASRMGRSKAALPLSDRADTFLRRIVGQLARAQVSEIIIVTGAKAEVVESALRGASSRVHFVHNDAWREGQLSSLRAGLAHRNSPGLPLIEAALVTLVDVPFVSSQTIATVLREWRATRAPIVRPARGDTHGHPVIFDAAILEELAAADPAVGAKSVVRAHAHEIVNVPVADPGAFLDIDTEEEYRAALALSLLA